ncbi:MAG: ParA family protein [Candidatus Nanohaloarchaea archaeon]
MAHRTSFVHTKGGTGKTTVAVNVAGFLERKGENVLLVDGDPEGHASRNLGIEPERFGTSLHHLLHPDESVEAKNVLYPTRYGVDVVPGTGKLHDTYHELFGSDRNDLFSSALDSVESRYDHVIVDSPSSYRRVIASVLRASNDYHLILDSSMFSQEGGQALKSFLKKLPDKHDIPLNPSKAVMVENREKGALRRLKEKVLGERNVPERVAKSFFGSRFVKVPYCEAVRDSQERSRPLSHFERIPEGARVFEELAEDIQTYSWNTVQSRNSSS